MSIFLYHTSYNSFSYAGCLVWGAVAVGKLVRKRTVSCLCSAEQKTKQWHAAASRLESTTYYYRRVPWIKDVVLSALLTVVVWSLGSFRVSSNCSSVRIAPLALRVLSEDTCMQARSTEIECCNSSACGNL